MCKININGVNITLTKEQLDQIDQQRSKQWTLEHLNSYTDACNILDINSNNHASIEEQLKTIIKAANYIDNNNQEWKADFNNKNTNKYLPYFEKSDSGWLLNCVSGFHCHSDGPVGYYYKEESTGELITKRFIILYNKWLG